MREGLRQFSEIGISGRRNCMGKGSESEEHLESPKGECGRRGSQRGNREMENSVTNFTLAE